MTILLENTTETEDPFENTTGSEGLQILQTYLYMHAPTTGPVHWDLAHAAKRQARSLNKANNMCAHTSVRTCTYARIMHAGQVDLFNDSARISEVGIFHRFGAACHMSENIMSARLS